MTSISHTFMEVTVKKALKLTDDPYRLAGIVQVLLRQNNRFNEQAKQYIWICSLATNRRLLNVELLVESDIETIKINSKAVITIPLRMEAAGMVVVHNHLDESLTPTDCDQKLHQQLVQVGELMEIPLWDHILINEQDYYSFKAAGLLQP